MKTAIAQLIEIIDKRIEQVDPLFAVAYLAIRKEAEKLEPVNEQQIKDAVNFGQNNHTVMISVDKEIVENYFTKTFEK